MTENNCVAERARGDILGMPVISIQDGIVLGRIRQVLIDGKTYHVQGFLVEKRHGGKEDRILPFPAVVSFGTDSVTIERQAQLERKGANHQYIRALRRPLAVIGSRVFTTDGKTLGKVEEYRFSTSDGRITLLELGSGLFRERLLVNGAHLIAISPQTVMLKSEAAAEAAAMENMLRSNMENAAENMRNRAAAFCNSTADATKKLTGGLSEAVSRLRCRDVIEAAPPSDEGIAAAERASNAVPLEQTSDSELQQAECAETPASNESMAAVIPTAAADATAAENTPAAENSLATSPGMTEPASSAAAAPGGGKITEAETIIS